MELNQVKLQIFRIKELADSALEACRRDEECPQAVRETVNALDMDVNSALAVVERPDNESRLVEVIDLLEESADRAKQVTQKAPRISEETRSTVLRAHDEISRLKHQLH